MKILRRVAYALLVAAIACSDASAPATAPEPKAEITDLEAARQRWRAQNLHTYAFTMQRACFCGNVHPLYVVVLSDTVAGVLDLETAETVDRALGMTVDGLFAFIQDANNRHVQKIRAQYDGLKGFPTEIDYDGAAAIADDEVFYRVSDVHPIP